jgi:hypothetical protein
LRQGWSPVQGVLPTVCKILSSRLILTENRPEGIIRMVVEKEDDDDDDELQLQGIGLQACSSSTDFPPLPRPSQSLLRIGL